MHKEALIQNVNQVLEQDSGIAFGYIFGSCADSDATKNSDVDIAVYFYQNAKRDYFESRLALYADLSRKLKMNKIDLVILNTCKNLMLIDDIVRHGIVVLDKSPDLRFDFELKMQHRAIDFRHQRYKVMGV